MRDWSRIHVPRDPYFVLSVFGLGASTARGADSSRGIRSPEAREREATNSIWDVPFQMTSLLMSAIKIRCIFL